MCAIPALPEPVNFSVWVCNDIIKFVVYPPPFVFRKGSVFYMKEIKPLAIIFLVSFLGEALHALLPFLPIPASIYGLVIMLAGLLSGVIKLDTVKKTAAWLIAFMPLMFVGPSVQLMVSLRGQGAFIPAFVIISIVSTVVVMAVTGLVCQALIRKKEEKTHD